MFKILYIKNRVFVVYPVVEFGNYDILEGWENALAKPTQTGVPAQLEEVKENQLTRKGHKGVGYKTESPITNKPKS